LEIVILDRASQERVILPAEIEEVCAIKYEFLPQPNLVAALRRVPQLINPRSRWCMVLDDRTTPVLEHKDQLLDALDDWEQQVGVVATDVYESFQGKGAGDGDGGDEGGSSCEEPRRGRGGLPEVVRSCAYAIRREALGCFDRMSTDLNGFASELDLSAALMRQGMHAAFDARLLVIRRVKDRRQDTRHLGRWLMDRLRFVHANAPADQRHQAIAMMLRIALRRAGRWIGDADFDCWERIIADRLVDLPAPFNPPLSDSQWDRLIGLASARESIKQHVAQGRTRMAIVEEGDDAPIIQRALRDAGATLVAPDDRPHALILGTLEPGILLDAMFRWGEQRHGTLIITPWIPPTPSAATPRLVAA